MKHLYLQKRLEIYEAVLNKIKKPQETVFICYHLKNEYLNLHFGIMEFEKSYMPTLFPEFLAQKPELYELGGKIYPCPIKGWWPVYIDANQRVRNIVPRIKALEKSIDIVKDQIRKLEL